MASVKEYIDIFDFTPGMFGGYHSGLSGVNAGKATGPRLGAATIENTYACIAEPGGPLCPLPKRSSSKTDTAPLPVGPGFSARYAPNQDSSFVLDAVIQGPVRVSTRPWYDPATELDTVTVAYGFNFTQFAGSNIFQYLLARSYRLHSGTQKDVYFQRDTLGRNFADPASYLRVLPHMMLELGRTDKNSASWPPVTDLDIIQVMVGNSSFFYGSSGVAGGAMSVNDQSFTTFDTDVNAEALGTVRYPLSNGLWVMPDPDNLAGGVDFIRTASGLSTDAKFGQFMIMHQGRVVQLLGRGFDVVGNAGLNFDYGLSDRVHFTTPYNIFKTDQEETKNFVEENPSGYGTGASFNSNQLVLVKHQGGGLVISGSLNAPQVRRLPQLESTFGAISAPVVCPLGMVYGTPNGVFAWNQGDSAVKLSAQLDGWFWRHERQTAGVYTDYYGGNRGRFGWWHPWVLTPNDFVFDTRTNSWWRLDDPTVGNLQHAPHNVFRVSPTSNKLYAFRYRQRDIAGTEPNNVIYDVYDPAILASSYSWQSQPLAQSRERRVVAKELQLSIEVGQGATNTSVVVTLTGLSESGSSLAAVSETFDFSAVPAGEFAVKIQNLSPNFSARYLKARIVASATGPAPKIIGLRIGIDEGATVARS